MIQWFYKKSEKLSPVTEWVRSSSNDILQMIRQVSETARDLKEQSKELKIRGAALGMTSKITDIDTAWWLSQQDRFVVELAQSLAKRLHGICLGELNPIDVDRLAPSLATCIRVLQSSAWNSTGPSGRQPKESDWVDCLHAMYAPYVDIFRTDSYMAPIVQKSVEKYGTTVVAKLEKLTETIEVRMASKMALRD